MILLDIEVYPNYFLLGLENYRTGEKRALEISEHNSSDIPMIRAFLHNTKTDYLVTFNGVHYDLTILAYVKELLEGNTYNDKTRRLGLLQAIQDFSDRVIREDYFEGLYNYKYKFKNQWFHIDLFLFWSKLLRVSKKISLKSLAVQLRYPEIQELPYPPGTWLTQTQMDEVKRYNLVNDLGILRFLLDDKKDEVKLRKEILESFGIECFSLDAIKIADEYLRNEYCRLTDNEPWEVKKLRFPKIDFQIKDVVPKFEFKTKFYQDLQEEIGNSTSAFSKVFVFNSNENWIKISLGIGGIHSLIENQIYRSDDKYLILTSDIASLYPNNIINYEFIRFPEVLKTYSDLKVLRIAAKKNKEKLKDTFYKLILNGTSGLLDQEHSWLYFNQGAVGLRMTGQLQLLRTTEELTLAGFQVLSLNTDGVECKVPIEREQEYYDIMSNLEKEFNLIWEHDIYEFIQLTHINGYIAKTKDGKIKRKGFYKLDYDEKGNREIPLGDSTDFLIIAKVLNKHIIDGIPIRDLVINWKDYGFHIYDFCASMKVDKSYTVYHNGKPQQRLNRFYASKTGAYLFKSHTGKDMAHMLKASGVCLFNKFEEKEDYKINYNFYLGKINEILIAFQMKMNTLF